MMSDRAGIRATLANAAVRTAPGEGVIVHRKPLTALATGTGDLAPLAESLTDLVDDLVTNQELGFGSVATGLQQFVVDHQPSGVAAVLDLPPDPIVFLFDRAAAIGETATHRATGRAGWTTAFVEGDNLSLTVGDGPEHPVTPWSMLVAGTVAGTTAQLELVRTLPAPAGAAEPMTAEPIAADEAGRSADGATGAVGGAIEKGPADRGAMDAPTSEVPAGWVRPTERRPATDEAVEPGWSDAPGWVPGSSGRVVADHRHGVEPAVGPPPSEGSEPSGRPPAQQQPPVIDGGQRPPAIDPEPGDPLAEPHPDRPAEAEPAPLWAWPPPGASAAGPESSEAPPAAEGDQAGGSPSDLAELASRLDDERAALAAPAAADPDEEDPPTSSIRGGLAALLTEQRQWSNRDADRPASDTEPTDDRPATDEATPDTEPTDDQPTTDGTTPDTEPTGDRPATDDGEGDAATGPRPIAGPPPMPPPPDDHPATEPSQHSPAGPRPIAGPPPMPPPPDDHPPTVRDRVFPVDWTEAT